MTRLGLSLGNPEGDKGEATPVVAVVAVATGSVGAESGLVVGDVLLAVNGNPNLNPSPNPNPSPTPNPNPNPSPKFNPNP